MRVEERHCFEYDVPMEVQGVGIDSTEIGRFRTLLAQRKDRFVSNTFSEAEQKYCFSFRDSAPHLAGTFAAKEAIRKATGEVKLPMNAIEIRREKTGKPRVWIEGKQSASIHISITHDGTNASAVALSQAL